MIQEENTLHEQIKGFEDDIYESKLRYRQIEEQERDLEYHNGLFHQVISELTSDESDDRIYRKIEDILKESNKDFQKAQKNIHELKEKELEIQRHLNGKINDCAIQLKEEREAENGEKDCQCGGDSASNQYND